MSKASETSIFGAGVENRGRRRRPPGRQGFFERWFGCLDRSPGFAKSPNQAKVLRAEGRLPGYAQASEALRTMLATFGEIFRFGHVQRIVVVFPGWRTIERRGMEGARIATCPGFRESDQPLQGLLHFCRVRRSIQGIADENDGFPLLERNTDTRRSGKAPTLIRPFHRVGYAPGR